jgi:hypothetical protein
LDLPLRTDGQPRLQEQDFRAEGRASGTGDGRKTVVLIGAETASRQYVGYEIKQSHNRGNGMLGIFIHNMKDVSSKADTKGTNPLGDWHVERGGKKVLLSDIYPIYEWVSDEGYKNLGDWIEAAAKKAGK